MEKKKFRLLVFFIYVTVIGCSVFFEYITTPEPIKRNIHITHFRYGTDPSIIRVNRGDQLSLTFSTRDTGHSFFLQDYSIDAKVSPSRENVLVFNPFKATEPPYETKTVSITAGLGGFLGNFISASRFKCHVYCGPMHGFEQGDLIVRPNFPLSFSLGLLLAFFISWFLKIKFCDYKFLEPVKPFDLNKKSKLLDKLVKWRPLQFILTLPVLAVFILLILAGIFGTKVGGRNIAVMFTWALWMFLLTVAFVPLGGRSWCFICPLPVVGEYLNRGALTQVRMNKNKPGKNKFFGFGLSWPKKMKGPWLRILLFLCLGSFSASLAGQPNWTAIVLLLFMVVAVFCSILFNNRTFCSYICPVSTFISQYSPVGKISVRVRDKEICKKCKEKSCLKGNEKGWGCPYGLLVTNVERNMDCGVCLECFKSCSDDNVSLEWRKGSWTDRFASFGEVWQSLVMMTLAISYSLTIHSPWSKIRDIVNVVDKTDWVKFSIYIGVLWLMALVIIPLIIWLLSLWGIKRSKIKISTAEAFKNTGPVFIPFGLSLWAAFFVAMLIPNLTYLLVTISDPFGWGWDLLGTAGTPWIQPWPWAIPWIQVLLVITGFIFSIKKGINILYKQSMDKHKSLKMFFPIAVFVFILSVGMIVYFTYF